METRYISEFIKLAEVRNYSRAADELFISQSSLTKHIKSLEADLGCPLFDRTTRKIELSNFGEVFLPCARQIIQAEEDFQLSRNRLLGEDEDTLRLGVLHAFMDYGMYKYITLFSNQYHSYRYTLTEADTPDLFIGLKEDQLELAFIRHIERNLDSDVFCTLPVLTDPVSVVMLPDHPLASYDQVPVESLVGYHLISSCSKEELSLLMESASRKGASLSITSRIHRSQTVLHMLQQSQGPALLLQQLAIAMFGNAVVARPVTPEIKTTVSLIYRKNRRLSSAARCFVDMIESQLGANSV